MTAPPAGRAARLEDEQVGVAAVDLATDEYVHLDEAWWCTPAEGDALTISTDAVPAARTAPITKTTWVEIYAGPSDATVWQRYRRRESKHRGS